MILYRLSQLKKVYGNRTALDIGDLEIRSGEIYALLGPNGAGKTTLLNILSLLDAPTSGTVYFQSEPVRYAESHLQVLRKSVVLVQQQAILFTTTVFKNLEFGLKIRKIPRGRRASIIEEALDLVGMRQFMTAPAHRLSGGETQRVALARALAVSPDVLLCDEPTASVDVENQVAIVDILKRINSERKITILFTTHDRLQAASLARQTLFLDGGRLSSGSHDNIFRADVHTPSGDIWIGGTVRIPIPTARIPAEGPVRVVINPEKIPLTNPAGSIQGTVLQVGTEKEKIRIVVDAGVRITLVLSKEAYHLHRPMVGDRVGLRIPPESIQIL